MENWLTKVARIAIHAAQGLTWTDKNNEVQIIKPEGSSNLMNIQKIVDGIGNGGGDTGGGDNPDHPSAGADYYAGSLADGEITEREPLWQGESDPTQITNVTLLKDVGAKFNSGGEGAFILVHLMKTDMTAGVKGAISEVKLNYDVNNVAKDGYFTTTSSYPIYIHASDLATHQELVVPINGIGENLSGKNIKAPELHITYRDDKTIDITSVTGYDNDGVDSGATGANYDVVVELISTFSTQTAVAQLPESINLFKGSIQSDKNTVISLAGPTEYYENISDGLKVNIADYIYLTGSYRIKVSDLGIDNKIIIPKEYLVPGSIFNIPLDNMVPHDKQVPIDRNRGTWGPTDSLGIFKRSDLLSSDIKIDKDSVTVRFKFNTFVGSNYTYSSYMIVQSITPYRK